MRFRIPKPLHGWREFLGEVAVVVLGVLLALGAQQAAETINQRQEASETRTVLTNEIAETLAILELRRVAQPCIDNRLKEIRGLVDQWGRSNSFKTPRWVSQATWFPFGTARFDAANSAGRLALLSSEEQYQIGQIVGGLRSFRDLQFMEAQDWSTLRMLQSGADALSTSDRTEIRVALQRASTANYFAKISVGQTLTEAASYGWRPDMRRARQTMRLAWKDGRFRPTVCLSIDTPPNQANRETKMIYPLPE